MKVVITYPNCSNLNWFFRHLEKLVMEEGGDGWCWIQCEDPKKLCWELKDFLEIRNGKKYTVAQTGVYVLNSPYSREECWIFSTEECEDSRFYESIVKIT